MFHKIYKDNNEFSGIGNNFSFGIMIFLISINKFIYQTMLIFKMPLLYFQIKFENITIQIIAIILYLINYILICSCFLKALSNNILI